MGAAGQTWALLTLCWYEILSVCCFISIQPIRYGSVFQKSAVYKLKACFDFRSVSCNLLICMCYVWEGGSHSTVVFGWTVGWRSTGQASDSAS